MTVPSSANESNFYKIDGTDNRLQKFTIETNEKPRFHFSNNYIQLGKNSKDIYTDS